MKQAEIDTWFLSAVTILADKYNIEVDIDTENRMVNFIGGTDEQQRDLAIEIEDMMGKYSI